MKKKKVPEALKPRKNGRPSLYSPELAERICILVSTHPLGIEDICKKYPDLPHPETIRLWTIKDKEFFGMYARAKVNQAETLAEAILNIADNCGKNWGQARLQIDSRKWLASKLLPKIYGDRYVLDQKNEAVEKLDKEALEREAELDKKYRKDY